MKSEQDIRILASVLKKCGEWAEVVGDDNAKSFRRTSQALSWVLGELDAETTKLIDEVLDKAKKKLDEEKKKATYEYN